eukprot:scaffold700_cov560-Prasinococcus_capsulatus_cf.AAC.24
MSILQHTSILVVNKGTPGSHSLPLRGAAARALHRSWCFTALGRCTCYSYAQGRPVRCAA